MNKPLLYSAILSGTIHCGFFLICGYENRVDETKNVTRIENVELTAPELPVPVRAEAGDAEDEPALPDALLNAGLDEPTPKSVSVDDLVQYARLSAPRIKRPDALVVGIPTAAQHIGGAAARECIVFSLEQLDTIPKLRKGAKPDYPRQMLAAHIEGLVRILVLLDTRGRVTVQKVIEADREEFEQPAIESAERFVYDPPTKNGRPVNTEFILPIRFAIE